MNETQLQELLQNLLDDEDACLSAQDTDDPMAVESAWSFEHVGVMTNNKGLVVRMQDGTEFQVTVVQSR